MIPTFNIITTCKDRLDALKQTFPVNLDALKRSGMDKQTTFGLIDCHCPQNAGKWFDKYIVKIFIREGRVPIKSYVHHCDDEPYSFAKTRNEGAWDVRRQIDFNNSHQRGKIPEIVASTWLIFLDADVIVSKEAWEFIGAHAKVSANHIHAYCQPGDGLGGFICVRLDKFIAVGGYDEKFTGYGYEDQDLKRRLDSSSVILGKSFLKHIPVH
jgi:predicted glycosyltransferase involved in capsule biosynthesis